MDNLERVSVSNIPSVKLNIQSKENLMEKGAFAPFFISEKWGQVRNTYVSPFFKEGT